MLIDHIGLAVSEYTRSKAFYRQALQPLGAAMIVEIEGWAGFGRDGVPLFWFGEGEVAQAPMHIAFNAVDRAQVRAFHAAALAAGGSDNGAPGLRVEYHPHYYAAYVIDPDGHNIEAVCHLPEA